MLKLLYMLVLLSVVATIYSLINYNDNQSYLVSILPLSFLISLIVFSSIFLRLSKSFVFKIFLLQSVVRYLLLPVLYSSGQILSVGGSSSYTEAAIIVMAVEIFLVYCIFAFFSKQNYLILNKPEAQTSYLKGYVFIPTILILIFLYIYSSGATAKISLIWQLGDYVDQYITNAEILEFGTFGMLLFNTFKVILVLYLISFVKQKNIIVEKQKKWIIMLIIIGSGLFIVGTSRFSVLLNIAVLFSLLPFVLSEKNTRKIIYTSLPLVTLILTTVTVAKFSRYGSEFSSESILTASTLNSYFAGFGNIAIGLEAYDKVKWSDSIFYFFNDTFQNVPILSKLTIGEFKTTLKFNEMIYGHNIWADQIVPLSISGLFHFGYIGLFIYSPVFMAIALYMENLAYKVEFIGYKYTFLYLSVSFSLVFMLNLGSYYSTLSLTILLIFIPLFIINNFSKLKFFIR